MSNNEPHQRCYLNVIEAFAATPLSSVQRQVGFEARSALLGRKLDVDDSFRASETKVGDFLPVAVVVVVVDDDSQPCSLLPQMLRDLEGVCIIKLKDLEAILVEIKLVKEPIMCKSRSLHASLS